MISLLPKGSIHHLASDTKWNAREFKDEVYQRASVLQSHIMPERRTVAIAHGDSLSFFADLYAVWMMGGCAACLNPASAREELRTAVSLCDAVCILTDNDGATDGEVPVLRLAEETTATSETNPLPIADDEPALMLFTSGTTGSPKAVVHSARGLAARVSLNIKQIGGTVLGRTLCVLPTHFGHGLIGNCLTALHAGGDLLLGRDKNAFAAAGLGPMLDEFSISFLSSTPSVWRLAMRMSRPPGKNTLKRVHIGSAPLSSELWHDVISWTQGSEVVNMYGLTETANWFSGASSLTMPPEDGCVGVPWGGSATIRMEDGAVSEQGSGEILLRTPSIMLGYHKNAVLTDSKFENGWYRTGDIGSIDEEGVIRLSGRSDDVINVGGFKVCPEEIDILMERHEAVDEACGFAAGDPLAGQVPCAAVRLKEGEAVTASALLDWARSNVRPEAAPRKIIIVDSIPKTDRGKIRRKDVAKAVLAKPERGAS